MSQDESRCEEKVDEYPAWEHKAGMCKHAAHVLRPQYEMVSVAIRILQALYSCIRSKHKISSAFATRKHRIAVNILLTIYQQQAKVPQNALHKYTGTPMCVQDQDTCPTYGNEAALT